MEPLLLDQQSLELRRVVGRQLARQVDRHSLEFAGEAERRRVQVGCHRVERGVAAREADRAEPGRGGRRLRNADDSAGNPGRVLPELPGKLLNRCR